MKRNHNYKEGDKVRVLVGRYNSSNTPKIGEICIIGGLYGSNGIGLIKSGGTHDWFTLISEVEPYKEEAMNDKIEVGDTVEGGWGNVKIIEISDKIYWQAEGKPRDWSSLAYLSHFKLVSKGNKMKEVIGYKLKDNFKSKEGSIVKALSSGNTFNTEFTKFKAGYSFQNNSGFSNKAEELGVLDLWFEPVYKSSEVVVQLSGNRTATIKSESVAMLNGVAEFKVGDVAHALDAFNSLGQIAGYNVAIKEFQLGCQTFTIKDLEAVNQAFIDFK